MNKKAVLSIILACMLLAAHVVVAQAAAPRPGYNPHDGRYEAPKAPPKVHAPQPRPPAYKAPPPPPRRPPAQKAAPPPPHRPPAYKVPPPPHGYNRYKFTDSRHTRYGDLRPGRALPAYYHANHRQYVVYDWYRRGLYTPPLGHQWLMVDGNFVLASIATGIVAHILLGH